MTKYIQEFQENVLKPFLDKKYIKFEKAYSIYFLSFKACKLVSDFTHSFGCNDDISYFINDFNHFSGFLFTDRDKLELTNIVSYISKNLRSITIISYDPFIHD